MRAVGIYNPSCECHLEMWTHFIWYYSMLTFLTTHTLIRATRICINAVGYFKKISLKMPITWKKTPNFQHTVEIPPIVNNCCKKNSLSEITELMPHSSLVLIAQHKSSSSLKINQQDKGWSWFGSLGFTDSM